MNLDEALIGLKAYKELDQRMALLWHDVDDAIVGPRTNLQSSTLPAIEIHDVSIGLQIDSQHLLTCVVFIVSQGTGRTQHCCIIF